jgi:hypothetical protein
MPRNKQEDIEELIETIKAHCPNIVNDDPDGSKVRRFSESIVFEQTHGVAAHKYNENEEVLRKLADAMIGVEEQIKSLPKEAVKILQECLPQRPDTGNPDAVIAALEEALGLNQNSRVELDDLLSSLAQASKNLKQFLTQNSEKKRRRATFDYEATMVYRMCLKIWGVELDLAKGNDGSTAKAKPSKFVDDHEGDPQGQFTAEVFNTLGITTKVSSAAKRLSNEGGQEALTYRYLPSGKTTS